MLCMSDYMLSPWFGVQAALGTPKANKLTGSVNKIALAIDANVAFFASYFFIEVTQPQGIRFKIILVRLKCPFAHVSQS